jgi:hypothetical protein
MPKYIVEDQQTEEQVDFFAAKNMEAAVDHVLHRDDFKSFAPAKVTTEDGGRSNVYITIHLPYGSKHTYEVGEVGK